MLQPQLEANPAKLAAASVSAGVPYLVTTHTVVDTGPPEDHKDELTNTWGLHTIRL
jgi:hypothetical protein